MDGEKKLIVVVIGLVCVTILVVLLFIALWAYKEIVAGILLVLIVAIVAVHLWGQINEQSLRHIRYRHKEEMPLYTSYHPPYAKAAQMMDPYSAPMQMNQYYSQENSGQPKE